MAKYYLSSGPLQRIVDADSAENAALWLVYAVHQQCQTLSTVSATSQSGDLTIHSFHFSNEAVGLGRKIRVSETAFERSEAGEFSVEELQTEVRLLQYALNRFLNQDATTASPEGALVG
ncbi:MAG: hypothetical protein KDA87_03690 [Planctomycetales bacterium]|nr:hypothetical protein [Planctomycetales bacterium]